MSFWSDASPLVKGAIVVGAVFLVYFGVAWAVDLPPFAAGAGEVTQQRGLQ